MTANNDAQDKHLQSFSLKPENSRVYYTSYHTCCIATFTHTTKTISYIFYFLLEW